MTQLLKSKFAPTNTDNLFSGIWIRWQALTLGERLACANIVLIPVWWLSGFYRYMSPLLLLSVIGYEWQKYKEIRLKRPTIAVVALLVFAMYQIAKILFAYDVPGREKFSNIFTMTICPAIWLWYISSNNIRLRLKAIAWAFTFIVVLMLGFWLLLQFVLPETLFFPHNIPTIATLITGQTVEETGFTQTNNPYYLLPYQIAGENARRYNFFFVYPEYTALIVGCIGFMAMDIKNRIWSWLLLLACVFIIVLSGTRIVWLGFPVVIGLRYLISNLGKRYISAIAFALIAIISFTALSVPPATRLLGDQLTQSTEAIGDVRSDSTEVRAEIYSRTIEELRSNEDALIWGHAARGKPVQNISFARVGSHSFILGTLLYLNGIVGTVIFLVFWGALFYWLYKTRSRRPVACFCILLFYSFVSITLELVYGNSTSALMIVLCAALREPKLSLPGAHHA
jgi:hypothetical protein